MMRLHTRLFAVAVLGAIGLALVGLAVKAADLSWNEAGLSAGGKAQEVNAGAGAIYVSDQRTNEIWRVDPATGSYKVYAGLTGVIDARPDAAGDIWVSDWSAEALVRIDSAGQATSWSVNADLLWGLAFDDAGRVWVAGAAGADGQILRFDPALRQLCRYPLPPGSSVEYLLYRDRAVWAGDYANGRILRILTGANAGTWWGVGTGAYPEGLATDEGGGIWYADAGQNLLGRLDPATGQLTHYAPPTGTKPAMLTVVEGRVWYTEEGTGTVGALDPSSAAGQTATVTMGSWIASPSCITLAAGVPKDLTTRTGTLAFSGLDFVMLADSGDWSVYQLPEGAQPWGIAEASGSLWIADGGRQELIRASYPAGPGTHRLFLPLIERP